MTRKNWDNIEPYDAFDLSAKDFQKKLKGNKTQKNNMLKVADFEGMSKNYQVAMKPKNKVLYKEQ